MIKLKNIQKRYTTKAGFMYVLQQINLDIGEGEFITIMGPSAAGKSTLLNILGMLDHDWEGEYYLEDHAVHTPLGGKVRAELAHLIHDLPRVEQCLGLVLLSGHWRQILVP